MVLEAGRAEPGAAGGSWAVAGVSVPSARPPSLCQLGREREWPPFTPHQRVLCFPRAGPVSSGEPGPGCLTLAPALAGSGHPEVRDRRLSP